MGLVLMSGHPADETLSAGTNGVTSYEDFPRVDDGINYTNSTDWF